MTSCIIILGIAAMGVSQAPADINGNYWSSCGTSYCRGIHTTVTPQVPASTYLNKNTGYGYSVTYNYGVQPDWVARTTPHYGSSAYNYGTY